LPEKGDRHGHANGASDRPPSGHEADHRDRRQVSGLRPDAAVVVTTVRSLKAHSGKHKIVAGKPLPPALLAENPGEVWTGAANLRKQIENWDKIAAVATRVYGADGVDYSAAANRQLDSYERSASAAERIDLDENLEIVGLS
jgi:formyltetrahydrofolate synthetase